MFTAVCKIMCNMGQIYSIAIILIIFSNCYFLKSYGSKFVKFLQWERRRLYLYWKKKNKNYSKWDPFAPLRIWSLPGLSSMDLQIVFNGICCVALTILDLKATKLKCQQGTQSPPDDSIICSPRNWGRASRWPIVSHDEIGHFFHKPLLHFLRSMSRGWVLLKAIIRPSAEVILAGFDYFFRHSFISFSFCSLAPYTI